MKMAAAVLIAVLVPFAAAANNGAGLSPPMVMYIPVFVSLPR